MTTWRGSQREPSVLNRKEGFNGRKHVTTKRSDWLMHVHEVRDLHTTEPRRVLSFRARSMRGTSYV